MAPYKTFSCPFSPDWGINSCLFSMIFLFSNITFLIWSLSCGSDPHEFLDVFFWVRGFCYNSIQLNMGNCSKTFWSLPSQQKTHQKLKRIIPKRWRFHHGNFKVSRSGNRPPLGRHFLAAIWTQGCFGVAKGHFTIGVSLVDCRWYRKSRQRVQSFPRCPHLQVQRPDCLFERFERSCIPQEKITWMSQEVRIKG